jgi:anti-sigma factor ChrR (cupin superfamily)
MQATQGVNDDPNAVVIVDTNALEWEKTEHRGVTKKVLERVVDPVKGRETALLRFEPGATMPTETLDRRMEIFVVDGVYSDEHGDYAQHSFIRNQPGFRHTPSSKGGCTLYVKWRVPIRSEEKERLVIDSRTAKWTPFPHRGADVLHLYRDKHGIETARIGNVHPEKRIPTHDHAMGEETLMLKGCLKDEQNAYTPGIWFRMPIGVPHTPYTEKDGCLMLIREGDLVW